MKLAILIALGSLLAAGSGYLASVALSQTGEPPTRTVTVDVGTGPQGHQAQPANRPTGPRGEPGAQGPPGPAGSFTCPNGFSAGYLVINHPAGR